MFFADLQSAVLECLRARVKNGQATERGLARIVGVSQPHMHNVLKGVRALSPDLSDQILQTLRLSLLDVIDRSALLRYLEAEQIDSTDYIQLPVLCGKIGPGHPWPDAVEKHERFRLPAGVVTRMFHPVVVRLAEDVRMHPLFGDGDLALLDQSHKVRTEIDLNSYYLLKRGRVGLIRRLRYVGRTLYLLSDDVLDKPQAWERLPTHEHPLTFFVRARIRLISKEYEWA